MTPEEIDKMKPFVRMVARLALAAASLVPVLAAAHNERPAFFPNNRVQHAPVYRPLGESENPRLVVCKRPGDEGIGPGEDSASRIARMQDAALRAINQRLLSECRFEHIQQAVNAVTQRGTNIYLLPGVYREQPSIRARTERAGAANPADTAFCTTVLARGSDVDPNTGQPNTDNDALTYEEQFRCPHIQNTVAIFGDRNFADDDCGPPRTDTGGQPGICAHPETVACNVATSACPYNDLQIEGTGERVTDVILSGRFVDKPGTPEDGKFEYLNGIRADRTDGMYMRNFTAQIFEFNALYIPEADGYVFDRMLARWNDEYGFLSFAGDHGLYTEHESYGNSDSGPYPGSAANVYEGMPHAGVDLRARQSVEMRNGLSHHNALGYSGTAGNAVWMHDNRFYKNQTGLATDSFVSGHPGHPQDHDLIENNWFYSNNKAYTDYIETGGPCDAAATKPRDRGLVPADPSGFDDEPPEVQEARLDTMVLCPTFNGSIGTGIMLAAGNYNLVRNNIIFDNWKHGVMLFHVPAALRDENDPNKAFDTSHYNWFLDNQMAGSPIDGRVLPNGVDFWHDNSGVGNCWDGNVSAAGDVTGDNTDGTPNDYAIMLHGPCPDALPPSPAAAQAAENPARVAFLADCAVYDRNDPSTKANCDFTEPPSPPATRDDVARVIASRPPRAAANSGQAVKAAYFVLDNDTRTTHNVGAVTITASGPVQFITGLVLKVTSTDGTKLVTGTASVASAGASNVFTFSSPQPVLAGNYVLFELTANARDYLAFGSSPVGVALASAGTPLAVLLVGGGLARRRKARWLVLILAAGSLLGSCQKSPPVGGGAIQFTLTSLDVSDANGPVAYSGLPLATGTLELH